MFPLGNLKTAINGSKLVLNLSLLFLKVCCSCATGDWREVKAALPVKEVPEKEIWRLGLLESLLRERGMLEKEWKDTKRVIAMLASLCST